MALDAHRPQTDRPTDRPTDGMIGKGERSAAMVKPKSRLREGPLRLTPSLLSLKHTLPYSGEYDYYIEPEKKNVSGSLA